MSLPLYTDYLDGRKAGSVRHRIIGRSKCGADRRERLPRAPLRYMPIWAFCDWFAIAEVLLIPPVVMHHQGESERVSRMDALQVFVAARVELLRYAARFTGDAAEAEDVVQEAWLRFCAATSARQLDEPTGYLFRIVRNLALDMHRRRARENQLFESEASAATAAVPSDAPSQQAYLEARGELAMIHKALAQLPVRTRRAFEMHRFEGRKLVEIAAELGISKSLAQELVMDGVELCKKTLRRRD
ncbi:sigma-70 family RNA polymerase sigma factor [Novosphingobium sp. SG707]|uniref:sigma-70 family RNA polymerase sigma factor n=1 Tax=Novosphingobium sp. SG707 TaxID=2586996 RepID=UPI00179E2B2C|nr:sigma-70 family RNA polymerase sigma factor [Novosphingobium sp. SG707]NKJ01301.1 RNA polymerase sigma factor (sigma-70 family) [Novosphingobium sp. SG707]